MCGNLWISENGLRIFTRCGNVFRSSENREQDMTYNGSMGGLDLIQHLSRSAALGKVLAIPEQVRFPLTLADDTEPATSGRGPENGESTAKIGRVPLNPTFRSTAMKPPNSRSQGILKPGRDT